MLDSFNIRNYRNFQTFQLNQTSLVNLIVGTNNSGKSSLLEAIYLLNSDDPIESLLYVLGERGEYNLYRIGADYTAQNGAGYMVSHIFNGHRFDIGSKIAFYAGVGKKTRLELSVQEAGLNRQANLFDDQSDEIESYPKSKWMWVERTDHGAIRYSEVLRITDGLTASRKHIRSLTQPSQRARLITTSHLTYEELSGLWDHITLTPREDQVIEALRIIEPGVERISFTSRNSSSSGILLKMAGASEPIPLVSTGDGMKRILGIIASLVSVESGTFLVDEIDTGLHYEVLTDMWKTIFTTAARIGTQVFATTHSWDCVRAFQRAMQELPGEQPGLLIRLERNGEQIEAITYAPKELEIAIKHGIEVR